MTTTTKNVYTLTTNIFGVRTQKFEDKGEMMEALDSEANGTDKGKGSESANSIIVERYEIPSDEDIDNLDEYSPVETEAVSYYSLTELANGKYEDCSGEVYDTEEETIEANSPSQYLVIS